MKTLFNDNWTFAKCNVEEPEDCWNQSYEPVAIPHDWLIGNAENLYETSFGRYKKKYDFGNISGKSIRLYFEGVYMDSTVYVNEKAVMDWKYGYSSFEADISAYLHDGENEIEVLVRHRAPNSRWYSGAGIFRNVWLIETPLKHLVTDGVYFSANKQGDEWLCTLSAETVGIEEQGDAVIGICLQGRMLYYETQLSAKPFSEISFSLRQVGEEDIWDIVHPNLLTLTVALFENGTELDSITCQVGLREIAYKPESGFYLNGRRVKLQGVCLHHDLGCLGAAVNKEALRRQLNSMRRMGVNAIRTSHNMPAVELMELCDEMGFLVNSEAFDIWEKPKTEYDYARFFPEWYEKDVASWIRRDRNHPSIIMWSIGNEIYDTHFLPRGQEVARQLHEAVRKHDFRCNVPTTIGSNYMPWEGAQACATEVDLVGYNYGETLYEKHRKEHPDWCIYGSETTSGVKSRGIYHFPLESLYLTHEDGQCSALGNCRSGFLAETAQKVIVTDLNSEPSAGMFIWTGSDYIGEPTPYSSKNSYFGNIDTAGLPKDSFYLYRAAWSGQPVLHVMPYWDFNEGQLIDVVVYTTAQEAELFVNGVSVGKKTVEDYTVTWKVPYHEGEIRVVADGMEAVEHSFGDSAKLVLTADKSEILANGEDLFTVTVHTVDAQGYEVKNARDRVYISVENGRLVGFDNGDSTDYDSYKSATRRLFSGKAVAYIAATTAAGTVTVRATAEGLETAEVEVKALPATVRDGISTVENIKECQKMKEIPVRKIVLSRDTKALLTKETPQSVVTAEILPQTATYRELFWSVVTNSGIPTGIAKVTARGRQAVVDAVGDGSFRLRCCSMNGRRQVEVLSELEYTISGFGQVSLNPYEMVPACLCTDSIRPMNEVREGGVSIKADNYIVGFGKTDFGRFGSDRFKVRIINWFKDEPFGFRLWLGKPEEKTSKLVGRFTYQANFIWQTYIENSYTLEKPICGEQDLYFEFDRTDFQIDFGGFEFEPKQKAYECLKAAECDSVHGDSYTVKQEVVEHIGNNVVLEFEAMDFSKGISKIRLTGKTNHEFDSVHIYIIPEKGEELREILEFSHSEEYITVEKELSGIYGNSKVQVVFLPGCDFDFATLQFEPEEE